MRRQSLTPNDHAKLGLALAAKRAEPIRLDGYESDPVTSIIDLDEYNITDTLEVLDILQTKGWVDGYVVLNKLDQDGYAIQDSYYVSVLGDASAVIEADGYHGMRRALIVKALHWDDYPDWARLPDGNPAHRWAGIQIQGGPVVPPMKRRGPMRVVFNDPEEP